MKFPLGILWGPKETERVLKVLAAFGRIGQPSAYQQVESRAMLPRPRGARVSITTM